MNVRSLLIESMLIEGAIALVFWLLIASSLDEYQSALNAFNSYQFQPKGLNTRLTFSD